MSESAVASRRAFDRARDIRRRFLMVVLAVALLWGGLMTIPSVLGWMPLGPVQSANNLAFFVANAVALLALVFWPGGFVLIASGFFLAAFAYVSGAQFFVVHDQLRVLLFFPLVGGAFLILGSVAGWAMIAGAFGIFAIALGSDLFDLTPLAASTFVLTLTVTGVFFQVFEAQTGSALHTISRQNLELEAAARQDSLTGLWNRRALQESLSRHFEPPPRPLRSVGPGILSLAFVDVDRFKDINDRFGHAAGDAVLVAIAEILRTVLDGSDAVAARIGGEEFAILLPGARFTEALAVSEAVRTAIAGADLGVVPELGRVTVSIGVASSEADLGSADAILRAADAAMYRAKRDGRDRVIAWMG
ncbi:GGDEF domain-containing protein [Pseudoxanthobacter sp. M-2]|uniref:GGDEF domain-containing protein n=1 Tax=Pseudoxanthobacter sp. M-2 TaxID=3078754 RepID=UPI0038FC4205